mgnify:CR=1 FL=1
MSDSNSERSRTTSLATVVALLIFPIFAILIFSGIISLPTWVAWAAIALFVIELIVYFTVVRKVNSSHKTTGH